MKKKTQRGMQSKTHLSSYERRTLGKLRIGIQKVIELIESTAYQKFKNYPDVIQAFYVLRLYHAQDPIIFHWHPEWFPEEVTTSLNIVNHILLENGGNSLNMPFIEKIVHYATNHTSHWFRFEDVPALDKYPLASARGRVRARLEQNKKTEQNKYLTELMANSPRRRYMLIDIQNSKSELVPVKIDDLNKIKLLLVEIQSLRQDTTPETSMLIDVRLKTIEEIVANSLKDPSSLIERISKIVGFSFAPYVQSTLASGKDK